MFGVWPNQVVEVMDVLNLLITPTHDSAGRVLNQLEPPNPSPGWLHVLSKTGCAEIWNDMVSRTRQGGWRSEANVDVTCSDELARFEGLGGAKSDAQ